jgi:hypothetical protein
VVSAGTYYGETGVTHRVLVEVLFQQLVERERVGADKAVDVRTDCWACRVEELSLCGVSLSCVTDQLDVRRIDWSSRTFSMRL